MVFEGMIEEGLTPGFADPVVESQAAFRSVLGAMSRPGTIQDMDLDLEVPAPLRPETAAVCLTLADVDTPLWLDKALRGAEGVRNFLAFHCGCKLVEDPGDASFAIAAEPPALPRLSDFNQGSAEYPDRSTTIILQVAALDDTKGVVLRGPGIETSDRFQPEGLAEGFWAQVQENRARFPRGVDLIFTAPGRLAALPRSTHVELP